MGVFEETIKEKAIDLLASLLDSYKALKTVANSKNQQGVVCLSKDQMGQLDDTVKTIEKEVINPFRQYLVNLVAELEFLRIKTLLHNEALNENEKKWIEKTLELLRDILKDLVELKKQ